MAIDRPLVFGDVIRVDPETNPRVKQPDDRRWMIVYRNDKTQTYRTLFLGDHAARPVAVTWPGVHEGGWALCEDES